MAQARMANIMALAQSIGGPQAAPQGSRPAEHDLRANGGASVQPTSGEKTALKPEPVPWPPAEGSDLLPLRPWSETWSAGATWERSSGSSASTLEVFVKCNYFRLYEKLAADEDYESLPALAKDYSDTLLRPRSDLGSFAVVDKAKRRIAALVEAFIARMARSGMYPPESPVELFPPCPLEAQTDHNLAAHTIYPMGRHVRVWLQRAAASTTGGASSGALGGVRVFLLPFSGCEGVPSPGAEPAWRDGDDRTPIPHGELHKAYLCLSHMGGAGVFSLTPIFDRLAVDQAFAAFTDAGIEAKDLIERMSEEYLPYCIRRGAPGLREPKRGQLLHGPPGTGKSRMSQLLLDHVGLEPVAPIMTAGEFTAPYKGVVEQALSALLNRGRLVPWLTAALFVDEIDAIVPKRSGSGGSETKVDGLSIILALYGGPPGKDVPNFFLMGATNRRPEMDEAVRRRLHLQFFVGLPDAASRAALLTKPLQHMHDVLRGGQGRAAEGARGGAAAHENAAAAAAAAAPAGEPGRHPLGGPALAVVLPQLVAATTGFSGFGLVRLARLAMERFYTGRAANPDQPPQQLLTSPEAWRPLIDSISDDLGFSFGGERLGALLVSAGFPPRSARDARLSKLLGSSTGRVVARLHDPPGTRGWYVQIRPRARAVAAEAAGAGLLDVVFEPDPELDSRTLLRTLAQFACAGISNGGGIESVVAVTGVALEKAGAHEEAAVVSHVRGALETAREYGSSLVALDVTAAADVQV